MKKLTLPWPVKQLKKMADKGTLNFEYPIQRRGGQWDDLQASLLIHSILNDFPVPPILTLKGNEDDVTYVLDGKQRITYIIGFMNGEYALHDETPDVIVDDEEHKVAGLKYEDLNEDIRTEFISSTLSIYRLEEATDEEIEELFYRWNNGTPLSLQQKSRPKMGVEKAKVIDELLNHNFMKDKTKFTKLQIRRSVDELVLLQSIMLMSGYDFKNFEAKSVFNYASEIRDENMDDVFEDIERVFDYLDETLEGKSNLTRRIHFPMFVNVAKESMDKEIPSSMFLEWAEDFEKAIGKNSDEAKIKTNYKEYSGAGGVKKERVEGRMNEMMNHFGEYFKGVEGFDKELLKKL